MAIKRKQAAAGGAPEWVMTYGDMMSLLLCFFIMLVALMEIRQEVPYRAIVKEIQRAFGIVGGGTGTITGGPNEAGEPSGKLTKILDEIAAQQNRTQASNAIDPGTQGRYQTVTVVRRGDEFVVGNRITFEVGSADLTLGAQEDLRQIAKLIRGHNNIVDLRGHASLMETGVASKLKDVDDLGYARAKAVREFLIGQEVGLDPKVFRLVSCGTREPRVKRVYDQGQQTPNRRVEVVVTNALVRDFSQPDTD